MSVKPAASKIPAGRPPRGSHVTRGSEAQAEEEKRQAKLKIKRIIYTGAFAAVTVMGTIYGAGLKAQGDFKAEKKQVMEMPIEERIKILEDQKAKLLSLKRPLEKKLVDIRARIKVQEALEAEQAEAEAAAEAAAAKESKDDKAR